MLKVENLRAIEGGEAVQVEYLGCLLWNTVSDVLKIPVDDLKTALTDYGLEKFMPRKINPRDAFRRVTKSLETRREPYGKEAYANLLVRDVKFKEAGIVRQLVREVVDGKNTRLEYKPVIQLEIGEGDQISITPLVNDLTPTEQEAVNRLPLLHEEACNNYDGTHVRYMIWLMLQECSPVSVRPNGGVSFVPQKHVDTVEAIKGLSKRLNTYQGNVRMWSIPVIDAAEHREMVEESLEEQVMKGSVTMIEEMKNIVSNSSREVQPGTIRAYITQIKKMNELVGDYEEMLEFQATKARENLDLAQQLAMKLMEKTETE